MSEIKSTLEMVLARAEAMCADAPDVADETYKNDGMKFAASVISDESIDVRNKLSSLSNDALPLFSQGMLLTFFRYIAIPRDDSSKWKDALRGIDQLAQVVLDTVPPDLPSILSELGSLLGRYSDHKNQLIAQLKESFAPQAAQLSATMAHQTGMKMDIQPEQHPKFNEEWAKVSDQLNGQYMNALDQYKAAIGQMLQLSK